MTGREVVGQDWRMRSRGCRGVGRHWTLTRKSVPTSGWVGGSKGLVTALPLSMRK